MPGGLPPVLVTNVEVTEEIARPDKVDIEDVAKLWRVYHLSSAHMSSDESPRLENFFWRIWSNPRIYRSIQGSTLAGQFLNITEGGNRVRTTPVPTPFGSIPASTPVLSPTTSQASKARTDQREKSTILSSSVERSGLGKSPNSGRPLPPILKKDRHASEEHALTKVGTNGRKRESYTGQPHKSSGSDSAGSLIQEKGARSAGKKKMSFTTVAGTRRARPGPVRKKSGVSGSGDPKRLSQQSLSPGMQNTKTTLKTGIGFPPLSATTFALPSASWQDVESPSSSLPAQPITASPQPASWLVDKDFRGKFVEHQRASAINLAGLSKSHSVRFLDELPEDQQALAKGKGKALLAEPTKPPDFDDPQTGSALVSSEDEDDMPALPRTKSQLSIMIDKERKMSGSMNIGPDSSRQENRRRRGPSKEEEDDEGNENELLTMARKDRRGPIGAKDKVAVDPDQPFRAAAKKGLLGTTNIISPRDGSRSPPPVF